MKNRNPIRVHRLALKLSNAYVIQNGPTTVLVDAGMPGEANRIERSLERLGIGKLQWIFLTHAHIDHVGSVAQLRRMTGARVLIHEDDAAALRRGKTILGQVRGRGRLTAWLLPALESIIPVEPVEPDHVFQDHFEFIEADIPMRALHTPGHTIGSSSLVADEAHLFAGDLVSSTGKPHAQRYYAQDWKALEASLNTIKSLKPSRTYPGHGANIISLESLLRLRV